MLTDLNGPEPRLAAPPSEPSGIRLGVWHPDQALASLGDHTLVTEEVHCGILTLPGRGMAPLPEGREESVAAHRTDRSLQGGENVFDRFDGRVCPWSCISWPGGFRDLRLLSFYTQPSSRCILSPHARIEALSLMRKRGSGPIPR